MNVAGFLSDGPGDHGINKLYNRSFFVFVKFKPFWSGCVLLCQTFVFQQFRYVPEHHLGVETGFHHQIEQFSNSLLSAQRNAYLFFEDRLNLVNGLNIGGIVIDYFEIAFIHLVGDKGVFLHHVQTDFTKQRVVYLEGGQIDEFDPELYGPGPRQLLVVNQTFFDQKFPYPGRIALERGLYQLHLFF